MPQPISRVAPNASIELDNIGGSLLNPRLSALALECISSWSTVDSWSMRLYITLAGGPTSIAAEMYLSLEGSRPKSAALDPLVKRLEPEMQRLYSALAKLKASGQKSRDKLAHWVWGTSSELPDCLLLADPRSLTTDDPPSRDAIFVYREKAFKRIISDNRQLARSFGSFTYILTTPHDEIKSLLFSELCSKSDIRRILETGSRRGKSAPSEQ